MHLKLSKYQIIILSIGNTIGLTLTVLSYFLQQSLLLPISLFLIIAVSDYLYISAPSKKLQNEREALSQEFIRIFSYFSIYIKNGHPVYNAIEETIQFASPLMAEKLNGLLKNIDNDKTVKPFMNFGNELGTLECKQVLVSIYRMSIEGGDVSYINQFNILFASLLANERKDEVKRLDKKMATCSYFPLIGSALTMIMITVGIINIMGGIVNGL